MGAKTTIMLMMGAMLFFQGCETVKGASAGAKKDINNTWHNVTSESGVVSKTDKWLQDHAW